MLLAAPTSDRLRGRWKLKKGRGNVLHYLGQKWAGTVKLLMRGHSDERPPWWEAEPDERPPWEDTTLRRGHPDEKWAWGEATLITGHSNEDILTRLRDHPDERPPWWEATLMTDHPDRKPNLFNRPQSLKTFPFILPCRALATILCVYHSYSFSFIFYFLLLFGFCF